MDNEIKLNVRELGRLREISARKFVSFGTMPASTKRLHELGLIDKLGGHVAKTGRVLQHAEAKINEAGKAALAAAEA